MQLQASRPGPVLPLEGRPKDTAKHMWEPCWRVWVHQTPYCRQIPRLPTFVRVPDSLRDSPFFRKWHDKIMKKSHCVTKLSFLLLPFVCDPRGFSALSTRAGSDAMGLLCH